MTVIANSLRVQDLTCGTDDLLRLDWSHLAGEIDLQSAVDEALASRTA